MTEREALKLALEALKCLLAGNSTAHQVGNAITSLRQAIEQAEQDHTYEYAKHLAETIFKQHYASDEHYASGRIVWGVNDTVIGILTQIDNMVAVMVRKSEQEKQESTNCNPHPKAPHGFNRNASHSNDRYTCDCEGWDAYEAGYQEGLQKGLEMEQAQQAEPDRGVYWKCVRCQYAHIEDECPHCGFNTRAEFKFPPPRQPEQETDGVALTNIPHPKGAPATDDLNVNALEVVELELPDEDEAVGWADGGVINWIAGKQFKHASYLYATLPQRKPLTDEEINAMFSEALKGNKLVAYVARAIEAAHGIKGEA